MGSYLDGKYWTFFTYLALCDNGRRGGEKMGKGEAKTSLRIYHCPHAVLLVWQAIRGLDNFLSYSSTA